MIMNILRNEKYCGDCILQKTVTVDCISKTRKANQGEAPMYIVENNHPAIISREVFNRVQEELIRRQALRAKSDKTSITATGKYSKYALSDVRNAVADIGASLGPRMGERKSSGGASAVWIMERNTARTLLP